MLKLFIIATGNVNNWILNTDETCVNELFSLITWTQINRIIDELELNLE